MIALVAILAAAAPATRPVVLDPAAADSIRAHILHERADAETTLGSKPNSYLAAILRRDFDGKPSLLVGRDAASDVRIDDPAIEPHHVRVTVVGDSFRVEALDPSASFTVKNEPRLVATLPPSSIGVGRFQIRLSHQRYPALIVFDPESPRFKEYKGFRYFPIDLALRYQLALTPNPSADTIVILSTRGNARRAVRQGWFDFTVGKTACRLEATRLLEPGIDEQSVSVFFRDATTGKDTYAVGRYIDPERLPDGRYVLDFNLAYNPACAFSEHYNCPIPSKVNTLRVAIRAGEMDSHYLVH